MCLTTSVPTFSYRDIRFKWTLLWMAWVEFPFFCSQRACQTAEEGTMGQWCRRIYGKTLKAFAPQRDVAAALAFLGHYLKMSACHCLPCSQCRLSHAPFPLQGGEVEGNPCHFTKNGLLCMWRERSRRGRTRRRGHSRPGWMEKQWKKLTQLCFIRM